MALRPSVGVALGRGLEMPKAEVDFLLLRDGRAMLLILDALALMSGSGVKIEDLIPLLD